MRSIEEKAKQIQAELHDAAEYAKCAIAAKMDDPDDARAYHTLSMQEMEHAQVLHGLIVKKIEAYRKEVGEPPADMQARYDWMHRLYIEAASEVRVLQSMYLS